MSRWLTNDPQAAKRLRAADRKFERALISAQGLPLALKVTALRIAREARQSAYDAAAAIDAEV